LVKVGAKWGYVDMAGKYAVKFKEGMARVKKDGKWGYVKNPLKSSPSGSK
jgi:hypothetical protein